MIIDDIAEAARAQFLRRLQAEFQIQKLTTEIDANNTESIIRFTNHFANTEFGTRTTSADPKVRTALALL